MIVRTESGEELEAERVIVTSDGGDPLCALIQQGPRSFRGAMPGDADFSEVLRQAGDESEPDAIRITLGAEVSGDERPL